ncbi:MAG: S41 family peptidase [Bacilli bacterium]|nr:S41 family peptidase [Bacilli bacterium]
MKDRFNNKNDKLDKKEYFNFLNKNKKFNLFEVIAIMIITTIFGMFFGGILMYGKGTINFGIKKELTEFMDTYTEILNEYYTDIDEKGLLEAGVNGMVSYLGDPYSVFMDAKTAKAFNEKVSGEYVGIGTEIIQYSDMKVEVKEVYENGPAYKAGMRNGDIIIKVDGNDVTGKSVSEISNMVKGQDGTEVKITVLRGEEEKEFSVMRSSIDIHSIASEVIEHENKKIGYIKIDLFAANTYEQFKNNLEKVEKEKIDSLIIDVRGNSGGYLTTVSDILELFLKKGDMIYQLKTKDKIEKFYAKTDEHRNYKIAVLVNGGSASASELLAACMKDTYGAYTVGTVTYGKSKVQKTQDLSNGSAIKYTFQEWLTPKGESVGNKGFEPDYILKYQSEDEEHQYDSQLQKALDLLTGKTETEDE